MKERKERVIIQRRLVLEEGQEQKQDYYFLPKGTLVYPVKSEVDPRPTRGFLRAGLQARKLEGEEFAGLQAWTAEANMLLYLDKRYWQRRKGTIFGAYVKSAEKIKVD